MAESQFDSAQADVKPDLSIAPLIGAQLSKAQLSQADLSNVRE